MTEPHSLISNITSSSLTIDDRYHQRVYNDFYFTVCRDQAASKWAQDHPDVENARKELDDVIEELDDKLDK